MSPTSILFDFETLAKDPDAAVVEIGCIAVNRSDFTVIDNLDLRPTFLPQIAAGRSIDADTIHWHEKKGTLPTHTGKLPLKDAVRKLAAFIELHNPYRIWAWGKDFERPLFENLCLHTATEIPEYQFRKFTCARDKWQDAFGMEQRPPERTHHALQDCKDELRDLFTALKALNLTHVF